MNNSRQPSSRASSYALSRQHQLLVLVASASALFVAMGLWAGVSWLAALGSDSQLPAAPLAPGTFRPTAQQLATLKIAPVTAMRFLTEEITDGKIAIDGDRTTPVFSPFSGRVTRLIANPGALVRQGQALFAVQASEFVQGQSDLIAAIGARNAARTQLSVAEKNEARQHELYDSNAGALKDWQQSQADLATAQAASHSADIALAAVQNRMRILGRTDQEIARFENSGRMSPEAIVTAPISGTVIDRQLGIGQYIQSGASAPQYSIGDISTVWLVANVRESDVPEVRLGAPLEVHVAAFPDKEFKARISYVAASLDPNTHRLLVRAEVENLNSELKPEMFASFSIISNESSPAIGVPQEAVIYEGETARVWIARRDGSLELRPVHAGRINGDMVEIVSGVRRGEKIVTSGSLFIDRAATAD